jgi:D-alanyl-D-alanine carboxypeptidase
MLYSAPARTRTGRIPTILVTGLLVVTAAVAAASLLRPTPSTAGSPTGALRREQPDAPGEADGVVPDGTSVFDDRLPAVAKLNPALLDALRRAATAAEHDGITFVVNSGWRSPRYEKQLLLDAVVKYGSEEAAAQWVATPTTSPHIAGEAVDLGPADATAWLSKHGAKFGLCQIYRNEPWHFELRPAAVDRGCPPMYADPTQDPRMGGHQ